MTEVMSSRSTTTVPAARRAALEAERDHLLARTGLSTHELADVDPEDPVKGRDAVTAALEAMTRAALDEITAALTRLDAGTYGTCEGCEYTIPDERLEFMPATRLCVECQQRSE
jgi:DnaK suppressor protein